MSTFPQRDTIYMLNTETSARRASVRTSLAAAVLLACAVAGCGSSEPEPAAETDTTARPVVEGLSPEQLQERAEPMSPEQAEQLGIIDTSIHVERQMSVEDSLLLDDGAAQRDTARR